MTSGMAFIHRDFTAGDGNLFFDKYFKQAARLAESNPTNLHGLASRARPCRLDSIQACLHCVCTPEFEKF